MDSGVWQAASAKGKKGQGELEGPGGEAGVA
jgi:hypothetical protein